MVQIMNREVKPVSKQTARKLAADVAQSDKSAFHFHVPYAL